MDDSLVEELFRAYRKGLLGQPAAREYRAPAFDFLLKQVVSLKLPVERRITVCRIWRASIEGLRLAREGRLDEASERFGRAWDELAQAASCRRAMLLAKAPLEAAHAYFEYKRGEFDVARARVLSAMDADLELESDDADFILVEMHRLQLAQNLMRIDLRSGEPKRAMALAGQILAYVEGFIDTLPVHHSWRGAEFISRTPPAIRRLLVPQVAGDVVLALSDDQGELETIFLRNIQVGDYRARPGVLNEQFRLWVLVKKAFHQKEWDEYLQRLLGFLPTGRRPGFQAVWYSSMIDLLKLCQVLSEPASLRLQERILRESQKWPGVPIPFRPFLGGANSRMPSGVMAQTVSSGVTAAV